MEPHRTSERPAQGPLPAMQRIMAATDLGPVGDAAIRVAFARASEAGGKLAVCHVISEVPSDQAEAARLVAKVHEDLTAMLAATVGDYADQVEVFVPIGEPAKQIHDCAEAWSADLVVIGRPESAGGILARLFRPKTVEKVVRWSPCAVLVSRRAPGTGRIVVGTDFSDPSMPVLHAAAAEQARHGASVYAIHCVPPAATLPIGDPAAGVVPPSTWDEIEEAMLARIAEASREAGLNATPQILRESAAGGLVQAASDLAADLVIVGTHGRGGIARLALGSVAQHVVNDAPCPVLVIRLDH
jgi:nucleotide-binding universal stress UspA family protein